MEKTRKYLREIAGPAAPFAIKPLESGLCADFSVGTNSDFGTNTNTEQYSFGNLKQIRILFVNTETI